MAGAESLYRVPAGAKTPLGRVPAGAKTPLLTATTLAGAEAYEGERDARTDRLTGTEEGTKTATVRPVSGAALCDEEGGVAMLLTLSSSATSAGLGDGRWVPIWSSVLAFKVPRCCWCSCRCAGVSTFIAEQKRLRPGRGSTPVGITRRSRRCAGRRRLAATRQQFRVQRERGGEKSIKRGNAE